MTVPPSGGGSAGSNPAGALPSNLVKSLPDLGFPVRRRSCRVRLSPMLNGSWRVSTPNTRPSLRRAQCLLHLPTAIWLCQSMRSAPGQLDRSHDEIGPSLKYATAKVEKIIDAHRAAIAVARAVVEATAKDHASGPGTWNQRSARWSKDAHWPGHHRRSPWRSCWGSSREWMRRRSHTGKRRRTYDQRSPILGHLRSAGRAKDRG